MVAEERSIRESHIEVISFGKFPARRAIAA